MRENGFLNYAVTDTVISLYWEKPKNAAAACGYRVYMDGELVGETRKTHFDVKVSDFSGVDEFNIISEHKVELWWFQENEPLTQLDSCVVKVVKEKKRLDISMPPYCAAGNGKTLNTEVIQKALDDCTKDHVVYIPAGIFMTGALRVHSDTELYLEKGAVLQGTDNPEDYLPRIWSRFEGTEMECYSSLLNLGELNHAGGVSCENVLIHGEGKIASGGRALAEAVIAAERECLRDFMDTLGEQITEYEKPETLPGRVRPRLINMSNCKNIRISGLELSNGASWNVHMIYSQDILTDHCTFFSENVWNGDGWDPDSSRNCIIYACTFYTGDDSIAIKSGKNPEGNRIGRPSEHIRIFDCVCRSGHGITIGSEMSGGVEDVKIWDCDMRNGVYGLEIKGTKKRGGYVRNVHVRDCVLPRILFHSVGYNDDGESAAAPPVFEKCSFTDVTVLGRFRNHAGEEELCSAVELCGFDVPGYEIRDILFKNLFISERLEGQQAFSVKFCKNICFDGISTVEKKTAFSMGENELQPIDYAKAAIDTMMRKFPDASELPPKGHFHYHQGVFLSGVYENYKITGEESWFAYMKAWVDSVLDEYGRRRVFDEISLDDIQPGILLFPLYERTKDDKYKRAIELLMEEIRAYPENASGGFWHKEAFANEMWLDGLYMGGPVSTMCGIWSGENYYTEKAVEQALLMQEKTRDESTGLWYHAYDDSKRAEWANPVTGLSSEFWGRSIGWVPVAVLDELDNIPQEHPKREDLCQLVRGLLTALCRYQGEDGRWFQVVDKGKTKGNWPENSCTCLYVAAICKAVQKGILEREYLENAQRGYQGVIKSLTWENGREKGNLLLGEVCIGTGVGDYAYYCARPVSVNDLHGMGAFLLMCAQMQKTMKL